MSSKHLGTDFNFDIPLTPIEGYTEPRSNEISKRFKQQRILIVDDNPINREVLQNILANWGVQQVEEADNGTAALQRLHSAADTTKPFDIVLLDMQMPGMTGLEVAQKLHGDPAFDDLNLVMLSSIDRHEATPELDAWMTKPVRQSDLLNALLLLLGEYRAETDDAPPFVDNENIWFEGNYLLLVEDNRINQEVVREILTDVGFHVDIRENGAEAVQAVQKQKYDAVLMDIQMPIMDGLEATRQIRALGGKFEHLPIIAMTAHALSGDSDKSLEAGMNEHVTKPVSPEKIFQALGKFITPTKKPRTPQKKELADNNLDLPELPGIDITDGLERMRGNWKTYRRILLDFRKQQAAALPQLQNSIQRQEWEAASSLAHTLKGSGGNIGAKQLYSAAASLEQACRKADIQTAKTELSAMAPLLTEVIEGIALLEDEKQETPVQDNAEQITNPQEIITQLNNMLSFLDSDLGAARKCLKTLLAQSAVKELANEFSLLEEALHNFDIESAKAILQKLIQEPIKEIASETQGMSL